MHTVKDTIQTTEPGAEVGADALALAWTVDALRSVWERQRDRVDERIRAIERAVAALAEDRLDAGLRRDAERAAHMLAGSVGMFGFVGAAGAAHSLELEFAHPTPERAPELSALALRVRDGVRGPVALLGDSPAARNAHEQCR
jgi:chemotaxis protein histidine kinase CheA